MPGRFRHEKWHWNKPIECPTLTKQCCNTKFLSPLLLHNWTSSGQLGNGHWLGNCYSFKLNYDALIVDNQLRLSDSNGMTSTQWNLMSTTTQVVSHAIGAHKKTVITSYSCIGAAWRPVTGVRLDSTFFIVAMQQMNNDLVRTKTTVILADLFLLPKVWSRKYMHKCVEFVWQKNLQTSYHPHFKDVNWDAKAGWTATGFMVPNLKTIWFFAQHDYARLEPAGSRCPNQSNPQPVGQSMVYTVSSPCGELFLQTYMSNEMQPEYRNIIPSLHSMDCRLLPTVGKWKSHIYIYMVSLSETMMAQAWQHKVSSQLTSQQ